MASHSGLITVMERAARKAAPQMRRDFGETQELQVSRKGPADFVSIADKRAEQTLFEELKRARPDWGFLMEEGGVVDGDPTKPRWIIDPLDGTTNFLHGVPHFAISIAVEEPKPSGRGEVTQGLVYQPLTGRELLGREGAGGLAPRPPAARVGPPRPDRGAGRDRHPVRRPWRLQAMAPDLRRDRAGGRGHPPLRLGRARPRLGRRRPLRRVLGKRPEALGRGGGVLLVREAGGFVTDFRGGDRVMERNEFLAASDGLHSKLHRLVGGALRA
jgi:myo-inositol-1(or 4)-monophosphatase